MLSVKFMLFLVTSSISSRSLLRTQSQHTVCVALQSMMNYM